jgi:hypothetical protein
MSAREDDNLMELVEDRVQWLALVLATLNLLVLIVHIHYFNNLNGYSKFKILLLELYDRFGAENL